MAELHREHHGDFKAFLRIEPQMFHELLQGLAGWDTSSASSSSWSLGRHLLGPGRPLLLLPGLLWGSVSCGRRHQPLFTPRL